ncbi:MAG: cell surface protein [Gimesia sp.]|nr:cell surface protein [Gimesia sp.]
MWRHQTITRSFLALAFLAGGISLATAADKTEPVKAEPPKPAQAKPTPAPAPKAEAAKPAETKPAEPKPAPAQPAAPKPAPPKPAPKMVQLNVYPQDIQLTTSRDRQSVIGQAVYDNGLTEDVTTKLQFKPAQEGIVRIENNMIYPAGDGETDVVASFGGASVKLHSKVTKAKEDRPISFTLDVMPTFMRAGCNTGSCHGAARGKDGFRLSLFGFDPKGDYHRLTRELSGRRINLSMPQESLLLEKAIGAVPHTGGKLYEKDSEYYNASLRWLQAGAPYDAGAIPTVDKVEIYPKGGVMDGKGTTQQVSVLAYYSDGTTRDVTTLSAFSSNNDNSATITKDGKITASNRGEAFIMARFDTHTVGSHFVVLPKGLDFEWPNISEYNYVDTLIHNKLKKLRVIPSEVCSDAEFLRRASLDICGVMPTIEEFNTFVADKDPKKREKLVDQLLNRKEFVEMWVMKWSELLQIRTVNNRISYKSALLYYNWLQERIASNVPLDKMVQELLGSTGGTFANAATNYYENERDTLKVAENVAQVFMGMRIQCAQCHNHPFDRWTMDDYYSFAAFFSQVGRKGSEDPRESIIYNRGSGEVRHMVDNRVMQPKFLGGAQPEVKGKDRRVVLASWLASNENPYFATNLSNIVWAHFFGKGIINEVDDVRISNPPVNPELLDELAKRFTDYNYDFKKLVRDICTSRTYQLATQTNPSNENDLTNFSHAQPRRLRAEVLLDCISQVTSAPNKFRGLPLGARAVQIADGNTTNYFLTTFGRAKRDTVCSCEVRMEPSLSQALHLLNGDTVNSKIVQGKFVESRIKAGKKPLEIVDEMYISCLTRKPTDKEYSTLVQVLDENKKDEQNALNDIFWSLLNSREFIFNH